MNAQILTFNQTESDYTNFRVVPFLAAGQECYCLVEEKIKDGKVAADIRRHLDKATFDRLRNAVNDWRPV